MGSVQAISGLANGVFVLAVLTVAIRLLLLARRTHQLPELMVGVGFFLIAGVTLPLVAVSGLGRVLVGEVAFFPAILGFMAVSWGIVALYLFTWRVFRPGSGWAATFAIGCGVLAFVISAGILATWAEAPADADPVAAAPGWVLAIRMLLQAWYLWTGIESLLEFGKAKRRLALGLSDPVVVNRFLLWGSMGVLEAALTVPSAILEVQGISPMSDPLAASLLAANGIVASVLMILTFMPPRAYVDFVRRRAGAAGA
jgi:hypothetical protein